MKGLKQVIKETMFPNTSEEEFELWYATNDDVKYMLLCMFNYAYQWMEKEVKGCNHPFTDIEFLGDNINHCTICGEIWKDSDQPKEDGWDDERKIWLKQVLDLKSEVSMLRKALKDKPKKVKPSDEEIETEAKLWFTEPSTCKLRRHDWSNGAKWLRDKYQPKR